MLSWLIFIKGQTYALSFGTDRLESFTRLDGSEYCSIASETNAKPCSAFDGEPFSVIRNAKVVTINNKSYCVEGWKERQDMKLCTWLIQSESSDTTWMDTNPMNITMTGATTTCIVNGQEVSCEEMAAQATSIFKGIAWFGLIALVIGIVWLIFWVMMLVDAIKHEKENKALWIIILFLANTLGAIIYYFAVKRPRNKMEQQQNSVQQNPVSATPVVNNNFPQQFYQQSSQNIPTPPTFQQPQQEIIQQPAQTWFQQQQDNNLSSPQS